MLLTNLFELLACYSEDLKLKGYDAELGRKGDVNMESVQHVPAMKTLRAYNLCVVKRGLQYILRKPIGGMWPWSRTLPNQM